MIRINQLKTGIEHSNEQLRKAILKKLCIADTGLIDFNIVKKSIDAREKPDIHYVYTVDAVVKNEGAVLKKLKNRHDISKAKTSGYVFPECGNLRLEHPPVVVGSGPAGLFCAYFLALKGYRPVVIERGMKVEARIKCIDEFWKKGILNPQCNVQFGEGGAGTFSDGKLNTGVKDLAGRKELVLKTFVENGAPEEILYVNKPHLGTDVLVRIVSSMRKKIESLGGVFYFETVFKKLMIDDNRVRGIYVSDLAAEPDKTVNSMALTRLIPCECLVLALGHSARDTFRYLIHDTPINTCAKAYAVGVRAEHAQADIDMAQYGRLSGNSAVEIAAEHAQADIDMAQYGRLSGNNAAETAAEHAQPKNPGCILPPADYKLACKTSSGRSVYSFCMCPGGYVVNSSSQEGLMCINGMSYSGRASQNANAAIIASVFPSEDPDENITFQEELERKAYEAGKGNIVSQLFGDFENGRISGPGLLNRVQHKGKTVTADINHILPEDICNDIKEAMHIFAGEIKGYDDPDVIISAVETRTSSPIRLLRDESMQSNIRGIYPAGEGAGYAGGITSAAIDGIKVFEKIASLYSP